MLLSLDQLTEAHQGVAVKDLIQTVQTDRELAIEKLLQVAESTSNKSLRHLLQTRAHLFDFSPSTKSKLENVIADYGLERIPSGPTPLPTEVYEVWQPRFRDLSRLSLNNDRFGEAGEILAVSMLPGVTQIRVGPHSLLPGREQHQLLIKSLPEDQEWLRSFSRANFEIDVVFNNGRTAGEVKFVKSHKDESSQLFARIVKQAEKLGRLARIFKRANVDIEFAFIFVGGAPTEAMIKLIEAENLAILHIPFEFSETK